MKIALFGATGKTGALVLERLLSHSHSVVALVRSPEKVSITSPRLRLVQGDVTVAADVERALEGCDAVISALGMASLKPSTMLGEGMAHIAQAMVAQGMKRVISVASAGILQETGGIPGLIIGIILRNVLRDHRQAYEILNASTLDWTVLRPLGLTDQPASGTYRVSETGIPKRGMTISRADVADFIIQILEQGSYIRQCPALAD